MKTILSFIYYTVTIFIENYFSFLIPIAFNRSTADLKKIPEKLINNVRESLAIGDIQSFNMYSVVGNEQGKIC